MKIRSRCSYPKYGATLLRVLAVLLFATEVAADDASPAMFRYAPSHQASLGAPSVDLGGMAWRFGTGGAVRSTPAVAAGRVVFGSGDGSLYALDAKDGREVWKLQLGGDVSSSPAIVDGRVIVMGSDGVLRAVRLDNGQLQWTLATGPDVPIPGDPRTFDLWVSSPTIVGETIFVGSGDGMVRAVELATGKERWSHATRQRVRSSPAFADGTVYVGSFDGHVYALDAATGEERWKFQTGDVVQSSPMVADGLVFFGSRSMAVFALDAASGALRWRRPHSGSWILASAAYAAGWVIVGGSDSHLLEALDATTGAPVWSVNTGARMLGSPTVVGETIVYGGEDFRLYTTDLRSGLGRSIEFTEAALYSSAVVDGSRLYVGSDDRHLYAFDLRPAPAVASTAPSELMAAAAGSYQTDSGDLYTLSVHLGRLALTYCTYPPALVTMAADGTFACPMLWGLTGRVVRAEGQPATALKLSQFGQESLAKRLE